MKLSYRYAFGFMGLILALLLLTGRASYAAPPVATYEVTITNLTSTQAFTPPLIVTHRPVVARMFAVGQPASFELKEIAENGNLSPALEFLADNRHVSDFIVAVSPGPGPLLPNSSITVELTASRGTNFLSYVAMLICTNDGFTGVNTLRLPRQVGESVTVYTNAYDAGTEINTEDFADLVPPCPQLSGVETDKEGTGVSNPALAENGVVHHHPGIQGTADLDPEIHGWEDPVSMVVVTRID